MKRVNHIIEDASIAKRLLISKSIGVLPIYNNEYNVVTWEEIINGENVALGEKIEKISTLTLNFPFRKTTLSKNKKIAKKLYVKSLVLDEKDKKGLKEFCEELLKHENLNFSILINEALSCIYGFKGSQEVIVPLVSKDLAKGFLKNFVKKLEVTPDRLKEVLDLVYFFNSQLNSDKFQDEKLFSNLIIAEKKQLLNRDEIINCLIHTHLSQLSSLQEFLLNTYTRIKNDKNLQKELKGNPYLQLSFFWELGKHQSAQVLIRRIVKDSFRLDDYCFNSGDIISIDLKNIYTKSHSQGLVIPNIPETNLLFGIGQHRCPGKDLSFQIFQILIECMLK